ncbi:MAG: trypsin-like serine peptidase [Spirulinaceae cyanobacterium]
MNFRLVAIATLIGLSLTPPFSALRAEPDPQPDPDLEATIEMSEGFIPDELPVSDLPTNTRVVIGEDDRKPVTTSAYPYSAIGRLDWVPSDDFEITLSHCTGTLIGRDLVLTNSHCLTHPFTNQILTAQEYQAAQERLTLVFKANMIRGEALAEAEVVDFVQGWSEHPESPTEDWAILRLDRPLGDEFGYLGWSNLDFTNPRLVDLFFGRLRIVGYAGDFPTPDYANVFGEPGETAGQHEGCGILGINDGLIFHQCDTNPGVSGSALLALMSNGRYVVLGLHAGSAEYERELSLPGGDVSRFLNRGVQVQRWADHAAQMRENGS